jgi:catechol 2,3-dioxygenase-like lactoylglutathione lyase family enzyme
VQPILLPAVSIRMRRCPSVLVHGGDDVIEHISMGVSELARSARFYDAVLSALGYVRLFSNERSVGYAEPGARDEAFAILASTEHASPAREAWHVAFKAPSREAVDAFHAIALQHGATDDGAPGRRPHYGPAYYGAFIRDPDGHRLEAMIHIEPDSSRE